VNFRGIKTAGGLTTVGLLAGTIFPAVLIIALGIFWVVTGNPVQLNTASSNFLPNLANLSSVAFLGISSFVCRDGGRCCACQGTAEPKSIQYTKAVFLAMLIIVVVFMLGPCLLP
jgi:amino acid transporter